MCIRDSTSAMLSAVASQRFPVCTPIEYDLNTGFKDDVYDKIKSMRPRIVWMAVPNHDVANNDYLQRVTEITKLADWRRRCGEAFVVISLFYGLARYNIDIISLCKKPGVQKSTIFGDDTQEAYMVLHNLGAETFTLAHRQTPFEKKITSYKGAPTDVTP